MTVLDWAVSQLSLLKDTELWYEMNQIIQNSRIVTFMLFPKSQLNTIPLKAPRHQPQPPNYSRDRYLITSEPFVFLLTKIPTQISTSTCGLIISSKKIPQSTQTKSTTAKMPREISDIKNVSLFWSMRQSAIQGRFKGMKD